MLEIESLGQSNAVVTKVYKFIGRIVVGLLIAIFLGGYLDDILDTKPFIMLGLIIYVIFGSLFLLVKDIK